MIWNSLHCLRQCLITATAAIIYPQLRFQDKQQTLSDRGGWLGLQTSLPHLMDSGIRVAQRWGILQLGVSGGRKGWLSKWIKKVYKSTSQPSDCSLCSAALSSAECHEVFFSSPQSLFFQTNVLEAGNKASRTDYCAAAPLRQSKLCLAS